MRAWSVTSGQRCSGVCPGVCRTSSATLLAGVNNFFRRVDREPNRCPGDGPGIQVGCNRLDGIDDRSSRICMQELPQDHENSSTRDLIIQSLC